MTDDPTLLRRYATDRAEDAFAELVRRHLPLVYSAALRRLNGDVHRAEDVTQVVFFAVAREARRLARHPALTGWLYTTTRHAVVDLIRSEQRRQAREQEAHLMHETSSDFEPAADWSRLRPVLDAAMDELSGDDREAVLLRFFQGRPFTEIGALLGLSEDTARKRVERALEKLRGLLGRRKLASTSAALATLLASETVSAVPASLAASVTGAALATGGASLGAGSAVLGALTLMTVSKLQIGIAAALLAGAIGLLLQHQTIAALRETTTTTEQRLARLANENASLAKARTTSDAELAQLRTEIAGLKPAAATVPPRTTLSMAAPRPVVDDTAAAQKQKSDLHHRYDPFLQKYNLTPEQADRFVALKIAIYEAQDDLQAAVRQAGAQGDSADVAAMRAKLVGPMWKEIYQLLGPDGTKAYRDYEMTSAYRSGLIEPMLPAFAAANAPLTEPQVDQLLHMVATNQRSVRVNPTDISTIGVIDWDGVLAQAGGMLAPSQLAVLQTYANQRKALQRSP